ncbi:MAG: N-acetylmuramoyl-L-alanine amidase, partial [Micromonosporaceae bacterium]|nr:N-acetylmuramoyl-L-alanine amidase [Micromonosporaceae bacterium]
MAQPTAAAVPKLYLDPGHGGTDSGAVGNGLREKD